MGNDNRDPVEAEYRRLGTYPQSSTEAISDYLFTVVSHEAPVDLKDLSFRLGRGEAFLYTQPGETTWHEDIDTGTARTEFVLRSRPGLRIEIGQELRVDVRLIYQNRRDAETTVLYDVRATGSV